MLKKSKKKILKPQQNIKNYLYEANVSKDIHQLLRENLMKADSGPFKTWRGCEILYIASTTKKKKDEKIGKQIKIGAGSSGSGSSPAIPTGKGMNLGGEINLTSIATTEKNKVDRYFVILFSPHSTSSGGSAGSGTTVPSDGSGGSNSMSPSSVGAITSSTSPPPGDFFILKLNKKENELEIKGSYDLYSLSMIDYGTEEEELVLNFEFSESNFIFQTQLERDETLWVLLQLSKYLSKSSSNNGSSQSISSPRASSNLISKYKEVTLGYSIDLDALSYTISTSSALFSRFPLLQKFISSQSLQQLMEQFTAEEAEAEALLDELNWSGTIEDLNDIDKKLTEKEEDLNDEILEFLIQWEEMDDLINQSKSSGAQGGSNKASAGTSGPTLKLNIKDNVKDEISSITIQDRKEILTSLSEIDKNFQQFDQYLTIQLEKLSKIQSNLRQIDEESSLLDTSYKNLSALNDVISHIIQYYSLSPNKSETLSHIDKVVVDILKKNSDINSLRTELEFVISCCESLDNDFLVKTKRENEKERSLGNERDNERERGVELTQKEWKEIYLIEAVASQKKELEKLTEKFISRLSNSIENIIENFFKLKSFNNPNESFYLYHKSYKNKEKIENIIKNYQLLNQKNENIDIFNTNFDLDTSTKNKNIIKKIMKLNFLTYNNKNNNLLLLNLINFHEFFNIILFIFNTLIKLSSSFGSGLSSSSNNFYRVCNTYIKILYERFFHSQTKVILKELEAILKDNKKSSLIDLSKNLPKLSVNQMKLPPNTKQPSDESNSLLFSLHSSTSSSSSAGSVTSVSIKFIPTWKVFEFCLYYFIPVIEEEEGFLKKYLNVDIRLRIEEDENSELLTSNLNKIGQDIEFDQQIFIGSYLNSLLSQLFPELAFKFLSLSPTYSESSGQAGIVDNAKEKEREKREKHGDSDGLEAIACLTILNDFTQVYYDIIEKKQEEIEKINSKYSSMKSIESSDNTDSSELDIRINSLYALKLLNELNEILILRINSFSLEQQRYLLNLKLDPKDPEVFLQVIRYVSLVDHTVELSHGILPPCVEEMLRNISSSLFKFITASANSNDKYCEKAKIINFLYYARTIQNRIDYPRIPLFFSSSISSSSTPLSFNEESFTYDTNPLSFLSRSVQEALHLSKESINKYISDIISSEFPSLSSLATRLEGVIGNNFGYGGISSINISFPSQDNYIVITDSLAQTSLDFFDTDLSIYIRRKDVQNVMKEFEGKLNDIFLSIFKKIDKHFTTDYLSQDLGLTYQMWTFLESRIVSLVKRIERAADSSYQIKFNITSEMISSYFKKITLEKKIYNPAVEVQSITILNNSSLPPPPPQSFSNIQGIAMK